MKTNTQIQGDGLCFLPIKLTDFSPQAPGLKTIHLALYHKWPLDAPPQKKTPKEQKRKNLSSSFSFTLTTNTHPVIILAY